MSLADETMDRNRPDLPDLTRIFGRIGLLSFGGPAAQIALMHKELVEDRPWLSERQFLNALSFCMLLPGPEAMQLATYAGWRIAGVPGGLIAGLLFVLPGAAVILVLAMLYAAFGQVPLVEAMFLGIKATVIIIVIQALLKVSRKALTSGLAYGLAASAFVGIFFLQIPFPFIILAAALIGTVFMAGDLPQTAAPPPVKTGRTVRTVAVWLVIWLAPLAALWLAVPNSVLTQLGLFFSKLAVVTFGGAYAVLAYMVQEVVGDFGWLTTGQMMDALGLAETTPGPLILVTEFVGFLAGSQAGGTGYGIAAAAVTLWMTFAPCFLWIFAGAPYIEWISHQPRLTGALNAITAAVVGVILNLSIWFALNVFFAEVTRESLGPLQIWMPDPGSVSASALGLAGLAAVLLLWLKLDLLKVIFLMLIPGLALHLLTSGF
ncbi:chromate efflux transporter [Rhodophyticola porphyridii]|uniref:chromate efflux transporter n=1 Tax=Rhodophyticola porphyridii TaxID=1852017 RepID=UPI0035CF891D